MREHGGLQATCIDQGPCRKMADEQGVERRGRRRWHDWPDAMREVQGTRSERGQGCDRARQRLHGLLRGVAVNAALVWIGSGRGGGGVVVVVAVVVVAVVVVGSVCSMLLLSSNHETSHDDVLLVAAAGGPPWAGGSQVASSGSCQMLLSTERKLRMRQERAASALPVV